MKCPICGSFVRALVTVDSEWVNGAYYDSVEGTCPDCGTAWQWTEVFTFDHAEDIRPIKDDDHL